MGLDALGIRRVLGEHAKLRNQVSKEFFVTRIGRRRGGADHAQCTWFIQLPPSLSLCLHLPVESCEATASYPCADSTKFSSVAFRVLLPFSSFFLEFQRHHF